MKKVTLSATSLGQKRKQIDALDFTQLKSKLMDKEEGKGWTAKMCDAVEVLYKQFLFIILKYPDRDIVPTKQIDDFWHAHILDTRRYMSDCKNIFGHYVHHYPYFGLRGEEDAKNLQNTFSETKNLWKKEFGKAPVIKGVFCGVEGDGEDEPVKCKKTKKSLSAVCGTGGGKCKTSVCGSTCAGRCRSKKMKSSLCSAGGGNCVSSCKQEANCVSSCKKEVNCVSSCKKQRRIRKAA